MSVYALVAEFDPQQTAIYRQCLDRHGLEAVLVRDGSAASRVLRARGAPTLLICDLSLPQSDGFSVIAELRRMAPPELSAILVFSAHPALRAAAWNLRTTLGIADVADKHQPPEAIASAIALTLETIAERPPRAGARKTQDELLHKILVRTAKAVHSPIVLLSIELREHRRIVGHLAIDELRDGSAFWAVLQQVGSTREPLVIPDLARHSLFGVGPQTPSLGIRAFATLPLIASSDRLVGTISFLDFQRQSLTAPQLDLLLKAGRRVADELITCYRDELVQPESTPPWRSKEQWAALERLALTDRLTGLSNRHAGEQALERELARARRTKAVFSLAVVDIDRFKLVNDRFGHATGDEVLKQVSTVLTSIFRASDLAVRWGGDEFLVLLPDVTIGRRGRICRTGAGAGRRAGISGRRLRHDFCGSRAGRIRRRCTHCRSPGRRSAIRSEAVWP